MFRSMLGWAGIALVALSSLRGVQAQQSSTTPFPAPASEYRAVLNRYCVVCHSDKLKTAGLTLEKIDVENPPAGVEVWEKVIRKLRGGAMPPPGMPRPDKSFYNGFPTYLETAIDHAAFAKLDPGSPTAHRLNRAEYANAVRDLLAVDIDAESLLPVDDVGYGFDNIGDVLSISPTLLERYLTAARKITRIAIGDATTRPAEVYEVSQELNQDGRMSEELPFGSRGGVAIRHNFPADGEYVIKIRLVRAGDPTNSGNAGTIIGVGLKRQVDVLLDAKMLKLIDFGGEHYGKSITAGAFGAGGVFGGDPKQLEYEATADAKLEVRFAAKAGPHTVGVAFVLEDRSEPEGVYRGVAARNFAGLTLGSGTQYEPLVQSITISGPYDAKGLGDSPSRQKIFVCRPAGGESGALKAVSLKAANDEKACATKILSTLAHQAYRRPATEEDLQHLMGIYEVGRSKGNFEEGIRMALERMLVGSKFLFRTEQEPANATPGTVYRISDLDLASRLSFFLWSSIPDAELLDLAERGKLKDPVVLEQQARRMLRDPRSKAFVSNFFGQWLQLRRLEQLAPDHVEFRNFDENLRQAFEQETELFLESMLKEDRPLMDLLDANYTFVNERLAQHYGIPNVYGSSFRRVTVTDENRRGLLGQGSILSLTSYPARTSVVLRGKWLLTNILATPPPAPPPNVPSLQERNDDGKILSVRQSMEKHRANPVCASCHLRMDPLGFALENFDGIGRFRTTEGPENTPIDTAGTLPDGTKLDGPVGLRKVLLTKTDQFATAVTEMLLTYAMGRGVEYFDEPFVRKIRTESGPDYRWSSMILGVIKSEPFQMRRAQ